MSVILMFSKKRKNRGRRKKRHNYTNYPLPGKKTKRRSTLLGGWGSYKKKKMAEALLYFSNNLPLHENRCPGKKLNFKSKDSIME